MYYAQEDDKIIGAPSIAGVLSQLKKRPDFNRAYIERYLSSGIYFYAPNDMATLFEGIYREPYGCKLQIKENVFFLERESSICDEVTIPDDEDEQIELFRRHLNQVIQNSTSHSEHIGVELSGGLDSSAVSAMLRRCFSRRSIVALTNTVPEHVPKHLKTFLHDESDANHCVSKALNLNHVLVRDNCKYHDVIEQYTETLGSFSEVLFPVLNYALYEKAREQGVTVLYSGYGGDESVSQHAFKYLNELKLSRQKYRYFYERVAAYKPHFPKRKKSLDNVDEEHQKLIKIPLQIPEHPSLSTVKECEYERIEGKISSHFSHRIETCQIIARHHGIRCEFPLANIELMRYFHQLPSSIKRRHGYGRYMMRKAMQPYLPRSIVWRTDKAGSTAPAAWYHFMQQLPKLLLERVTPEYSGILADYVDIPALIKHAEKQDFSHAALQRLCLMVLMFTHLERQK